MKPTWGQLRDVARQFPLARMVARRVRRLASACDSLLFRQWLMRCAESYLCRYYTYQTTRLWSYDGPLPLWFDHRADLHRWSRSRSPLWVERGVYSRELMGTGCSVLDLCCGDGFYSYHFYSLTAGHIDAVDRHPAAIQHARRLYAHSVIEYHNLDIVTHPFPRPRYDVIVWDASIQYFAPREIHRVCEKIAATLEGKGVLAGSTILMTEARAVLGEKHHFRSANELRDMLQRVFPFVAILETIYPDRHNVYFRCAFEKGRLGRFELREARPSDARGP